MGTHHHHHEQRIPKAALLGAGALLLATLALSAEARSSRLAEPAAATAPAVQQQVELRFEDRPDGSVAVLDAHSAREVAVVPPAEGGFVRGVMRGMFRTRKLESIPADGHFRLTRFTDGTLVIEDPQSGRRVDLRAFGATNHAAFAHLLETSGGVR